MSKKQSSYEGLQENIKSLNLPGMEVIKNKYPDREYTVTLETNELTCICPKTGLPDFGDIEVEYAPDKSIVELKSFKLYLVGYRDVGIFHEHLTNKILDDFVKAVNPRWAVVTIGVQPRGGIYTTVTAEYEKKGKK